MATTTVRHVPRWGALVLVAVLAPGALIAACSSNDANPQPTTPIYDVGNDSGTPVGSSDSGPIGVSNDAAPGDDASQDGAPLPPRDAAGCTSDSGCWSCTPATPGEFLNQCTSSQCSPFDNATRLPNYDGGLPPLN